MSKTFCIKPWTHVMVNTSGAMKLCCISAEKSAHNLKTSSVTDWWNSEFVADVRQQMLEGKAPLPCSACFTLEKHGGVSLRQQSNKEYKIIEKYASKLVDHFDYPSALPVDVEVGLTNLCNLKCVMCFEQNSSSIATENKVLKISRIDQKDYDVGQTEVAKIKELMLSKPKVINFRGGESFMVPVIKELLTWGIENNLLTDTMIHMTTNGTKVTDDWVQILTKLGNVRIMLSIDGVGPVNDYIRFGSKWAVVNAAAKTLSSIPGVNFVVHATVTNLNVLSIGDLINWCKDNNYFLDLGILTYPEIFEIGVFPAPLLTMAKERLQLVDSEAATLVINSINAATPKSIAGLKEEINMRDNIRHVSILDVIPELGPYWHAKNETR